MIPLPESEAEELFHEHTARVSTSTPRAPAPSLQWVSVGKGGKVSNVRTVRSHVSRDQHQKQRQSKRADLDKLLKQRVTRLRPNRTYEEESSRRPQNRDTECDTVVKSSPEVEGSAGVLM